MKNSFASVLLGTLCILNATHESRAAMGNFEPLDCNPVSFNGVTCSSWETKFGSSLTHNNLVIIPCNECIRMDIAGAELLLNGGLDIQGKLLFPDGYKLILKTTHIVVQGELEMTASRAVTDSPDVEFILFGKDTSLKFNPLAPNSKLNSSVGKKSITVAGGRINILALPEDTPTWVKLYDTISGNGNGPTPNAQDAAILTFTPPPAGCDSTSIISETFTNGIPAHPWTGSLGAQYEFNSARGLRVYDRKGVYHGPQIDLKNIDTACLVPDRTYFITARIAYGGNLPTTGQSTECAQTGEKCLEIRYEYMEPDGRARSYQKTKELQFYSTKNGEDFVLAFEIIFTEAEVNVNNVYGSFRIFGVDPSADIELKEFSLSLPPQAAYPSPGAGLCSNLVTANGNADAAGMHPFPFYRSNSSSKVVVVKDGAETYFQITRGGTWDKSGLMWSVPASCVEKSAKYSLYARVRVNSGSEKDGRLRFLWKADNEGSDVWKTLMECPMSTNSEWVDCSAAYTIPEEMDTGNELDYDIYISTVDADGNLYPAVPYDISKLDFGVEGGAPVSIVVDNAVKGKWGIGAEILLTSHTNRNDDSQVRTITEINDIPFDDQHVAVTLHDSFQKPIVERNNPHPQTAIEVALLSRTIQFSGEFDEDPGVLHGCHFWIKHTTTAKQTLEGVGFVNCGQQGNLGRYPIHYHHSNSVSGSVISKNLVKDSNQRGIVVHGTDDLLVKENVLYNIMGHGFLLEDGIEQYNTFANNLAASNKPVVTVISDKESDNKPASFWVTNPTNNFTGNVAAGSTHNGFWFELQVRGKKAKTKVFESSSKKPHTEPLLLFTDNVSHSNDQRGFSTYPHRGYSPDVGAEFLRFSLFRNYNEGIFINHSRNLYFLDCLLADNHKGFRLNDSGNILLKNSEVIGVTPGYLELMQTQDVNPPCRNNVNSGIDLDNRSPSNKDHSLTVQDVNISGFDNTGCDESYIARIKPKNSMPGQNFDGYTTFEGTQYNGLERPARINFCSADDIGVDDIYLTDKNSALGPASISGTSTFISNTPTMTKFVQGDDCQDTLLCSLYCKNTCFHTIEYTIPYAFDTEKYKLKTCDMANPTKCVEFSGSFKDMSELEATKYHRTRKFSIHLPPGDYNAVFLDNSGSNTWPTSVHTKQKGDLCPTGVKMNLNELVADCTNLIKNGEPNIGTEFWTHGRYGVRVYNGAFTSINTTSNKPVLSQWLDTRCVEQMQGRKYKITARVRMEDGGKPWLCKPNSKRCPKIMIRAEKRSHRWEVAKMIAENGLKDGDYELVYGVFEIRPEMLVGSRILFQIEQNVAGKSMFVKDIAMKLMPEAPNNCANNLVLNGNFDTGDSSHWDDISIVEAEVIGCEDNAVFTFTTDGNVEQDCAWIKKNLSKRKTYCEQGAVEKACKLTCDNCQEQSPNFAASFTAEKSLYVRTHLHHGCMNEGERYFVKAKFMVLDKDGKGVACNNDRASTKTCPELRLRSDTKTNDARDTKTVARAVGSQLAGSWNELYGEFNVSPNDANGDYHQLYLSRTIEGQTYILDNFEVQKMSWNPCSELIFNGNLDIGFAGVFERFGSGTLSDVLGSGNTGLAVQVSNRQSHNHGLRYIFPSNLECFNPGATFQVSADIKMVDSTGNGAPCLITQDNGNREDACPAVRIELKDSLNKRFINNYLRGYAAAWDPAAFNSFVATFSVPQKDDSKDPWNGVPKWFSVGVLGFKSDYTLIFDNLSIKKLSDGQSIFD